MLKFRQIVHTRIKGEETAAGAGFGAGALFDQVLHLCDRAQSGTLRRRDPERGRQARARVRIHCQHLAPHARIGLSQKRSEGRLPDPTFPTDRQLHTSTAKQVSVCSTPGIGWIFVATS